MLLQATKMVLLNPRPTQTYSKQSHHGLQHANYLTGYNGDALGLLREETVAVKLHHVQSLILSELLTISNLIMSQEINGRG